MYLGISAIKISYCSAYAPPPCVCSVQPVKYLAAALGLSIARLVPDDRVDCVRQVHPVILVLLDFREFVGARGIDQLREAVDDQPADGDAVRRVA